MIKSDDFVNSLSCDRTDHIPSFYASTTFDLSKRLAKENRDSLADLLFRGRLRKACYREENQQERKA